MVTEIRIIAYLGEGGASRNELGGRKRELFVSWLQQKFHGCIYIIKTPWVLHLKSVHYSACKFSWINESYSWSLWMEVCNIVQEAVIKTIPKNKLYTIPFVGWIWQSLIVWTHWEPCIMEWLLRGPMSQAVSQSPVRTVAWEGGRLCIYFPAFSLFFFPCKVLHIIWAWSPQAVKKPANSKRKAIRKQDRCHDFSRFLGSPRQGSEVSVVGTCGQSVGHLEM